MSIVEEITHCVARGTLFPIEPTLPSGKIVRHLFGSTEIRRLLSGPWSNESEEIRSGRLRQDFDRFVEGGLISIALHNPYRKSKTAFLARLDPGHDEVWEIRSRDPRPGIRVFGRFAGLDVFVVFNWEFRERLGGPGSAEFKFEINKAKSEWRRNFPTYEPISGDYIHDFVSDGCFPA